MRSAALDSDGAGDASDDCGKEFEDLGDFGPVYFNHNEYGFSC